MKRYDLEGLLNQVQERERELSIINNYIDRAANNYSELYDVYKPHFLEARKAGKDTTKDPVCVELKHKMEIEKTREEILYKEQLSKQIELATTKSNYRIAVATMAVPYIASAVEKFKNKKIGPATAEKIQNDFTNQMENCEGLEPYRIYISSDKSNIILSGPGICKSITIYPLDDDGNTIKLIDRETDKIIPCLKYLVPGKDKFIEDPKEQARLIILQHEKLMEARQALNDEIDRYNESLPYSFIDREPAFYGCNHIKFIS